MLRETSPEGRSDLMKRRILLVIFILPVIIFTGCWDQRELNKIGIVTAMGIDKEGDEFVVTVEVIKPEPVRSGTSVSDNNDRVTYTQGRGKSVFDAVRNITLKFDRKAFFSHNSIIIFGEDFAKDGIIKYLDLINRDQETRETSYLLVAEKAKSYEVMGINAGIEEIPGRYIQQLVENEVYNVSSLKMDLVGYLRDYYNVGKQPIIGKISILKKENLNDNGSKYELSVEGASIFNGGRLSGYLNADETECVNFIKGNIGNSIITFNNPEKVPSDGLSTSTPRVGGMPKSVGKDIKQQSVFEIEESKVKRDVEIVDGKILMKVNIKIRGNLAEESGDIDISKREVIEAVEEACSKQLQEDLKKNFETIQRKYKLDVFGFGQLFHIRYPDEWKNVKDNWAQVFSESDCKIEVETHIHTTNLTNTPTGKEKGK